MKRHVRDSQGRLLQVDKGWKNLRSKQQELMANELRTRYIAAYEAEGKEPSKKKCEKLVYEVVGIIEAKNIWLPTREIFAYFHKRKKRWLNKHIQRKGTRPGQAGVERASASSSGEQPCATSGKEIEDRE